MSQSSGPVSDANVLSLLLVEGPTESLFYGRIKRLFLDRFCSVTIEPITGLFNVNKKILSALKTRHIDRHVRAYCCLDRETRYSKTPQFDLGFIRNKIVAMNIRNVLSVDAIIATQMIESWFFYDIEGIYQYLRVPHSQRNLKAFNPPEAFRESHLKQLFRKHDKIYHEGRRASHFIDNLNVAKIVAECTALRDGINLILAQGNNCT